MRATVTQHFSGPLPPPQVLSQYEQIVPGAAKRILAMAEKQSRHRREMEASVIGSDVRNSRLGLYFGFSIGVCGLVCSVVIAIFGQPWAAGLIGVGTLVSLVGTFVYGSKQRREEREQKAQR